jgi:hypothetical protein
MDLLLSVGYAIIDVLPKRSARKGKMKQYAICPKCAGYIPNNEHPGAYPGAISRVDNKTEICSACGTEEALADLRLQEADKVEDALWEAILDFANNTDPNLSSELAEAVSVEIINLKNFVHLTTKKGE